MAFQANIPFSDFLRQTARSSWLNESAPAVNFLLEERLPIVREQHFLSLAPTGTPTGWSIGFWWDTFNNYYQDKIALTHAQAGRVATFSSDNSVNHLPIESNQDVVRVESIAGLFRLWAGDYANPSELSEELQGYITAKQLGTVASLDENRLSRLQSWLDELNRLRDARPAFVATFGEMEPLLAHSDWPLHLRDALGLAHLAGSKEKPLPILLCRYNLSRVERAARKAKAASWAAVPTVLEAGGANGPGTAFFPFPKKAANSNPLGFGVTVNLAANDDLDFKSEMLHFRLDYTLDDFYRVGKITDEITEARLASARKWHFNLLELDFQFRADVP